MIETYRKFQTFWHTGCQVSAASHLPHRKATGASGSRSPGCRQLGGTAAFPAIASPNTQFLRGHI